MKVCTKCKEEKELNQYFKCSANKDGLQYQCRLCSKNDNKARYKDSLDNSFKKPKVDNYKYKETRRAYYLKNREKILAQKKENDALDRKLKEKYEQSLKLGK